MPFDNFGALHPLRLTIVRRGRAVALEMGELYELLYHVDDAVVVGDLRPLRP